MIELILLFILLCVAGAGVVVVAGATFVYLFGVLVFKLVLLPFKLTLALGKGALLVVGLVVLVLAKLLSALFAVAFTFALAFGCVWLVARALGRKLQPGIGHPLFRGANCMHDRMRYFEQRMLRLEQVLNKSNRGEGAY